MEKTHFKIETWQMLFMCVTSAFAVVILNSLAYGLTVESVFDSLIHTFFIASSVSIGILYFSPKIYELPTSKRLLILILVIFFTTIIGISLTKVFLSFFNNSEFRFIRLIPSSRTTIFSLIISYVFGMSAYFYLHSQNKLRRTKELLRQKELDEAKAKSLAVSAQLASLESKIQPHFLFNTLNSIAALIKENPILAEKMVEKLSALLRYSLSFEPNKLVALAEELKIIPPASWSFAKNPHTFDDRPLSYYIAHESTHILESVHTSSMSWQYPTWLIEGYADYVGKGGDFDFDKNLKLLKEGAPELDPKKGLYRRYHLCIAYLLDVKKFNIKDVFANPPDEKQILAELREYESFK